jgi:hypothetical protein
VEEVEDIVVFVPMVVLPVYEVHTSAWIPGNSITCRSKYQSNKTSLTAASLAASMMSQTGAQHRELQHIIEANQRVELDLLVVIISTTAIILASVPPRVISPTASAWSVTGGNTRHVRHWAGEWMEFEEPGNGLQWEVERPQSRLEK